MAIGWLVGRARVGKCVTWSWSRIIWHSWVPSTLPSLSEIHVWSPNFHQTRCLWTKLTNNGQISERLEERTVFRSSHLSSSARWNRRSGRDDSILSWLLGGMMITLLGAEEQCAPERASFKWSQISQLIIISVFTLSAAVLIGSRFQRLLGSRRVCSEDSAWQRDSLPESALDLSMTFSNNENCAHCINKGSSSKTVCFV